ncbi:MAG TPA: UDP-N-acetylglucosamine 2-epimerase (non-hydrolyzing) [Desulfobacteraceae bacterium]|jgi:UDP-N-acetylglucosamine 2-epimerase (non-hydrolysing)|nr:UDP-N-acetylglucosamine 2-epimerase (non-hydrolyzing) [Bacteroidales bacterium]HPQ27548.1 UDP-N-acetylglucosamine 2-epimerase (non-hydrolyzing) [Desulfobacteraceae bacterium]
MKDSKLKVLTVVGTRPEIIRLSRVMSLLDKHVNHIIAHTGQNYDYELNEIFYKDLDLRKPDFFLNVDVSSLEASVGDIIRKSGELLRQEKPDALLVLGDTNSCLSAYMAKRLHIPIFHMEAGNRCFDFNVPEEINRRIIDHIADFNLVYTEHARRHLISEGLPHRRIYLTGSPMNEVLNYYRPNIDNSMILDTLGLEQARYFVVSVHREENVDNPVNLEKILVILNQLAEDYRMPVIVTTHPRTRKRLEAVENTKMDSRIQFLKPFGFTDYVHLQKNALCTVSDSGTISEESAILNFPAISLRTSMERPEAQDAGTIILTGFNPEVVRKSIELVITEHSGIRSRQLPIDYQVPDTSWRVLKLIQGNTNLSNIWHGVLSH